MKAMIFAAGLGTRLGEITHHKPKALIEVGGEAMLKRVILKLKSAGVDEFVVNVHHLAQQIEDYLKLNDNFGVRINISDERDVLLDTGGGLLKARKYFNDGEPFIVHNADILTDFDIINMLEEHKRIGADVSLLVADRPSSRHLLFNIDMFMTGWENTGNKEIRSPWDEATVAASRPFAFGGVHILNPEVLDTLGTYGGNEAFSITPFYTDMCATLKISGYIPRDEYQWIDIGKPESLMRAQSIVSKLRPMFQGE